MLSLQHGFQPSCLSPLVDFYWPVRSLWPRVRPLDIHRDMLRHMEDMRRSRLDFLEDLQRHFFQDFDLIPSSGELQSVPISVEKKGDGFAVTVEAKDYSPEELSVKQVGNKLQVSGKSEKKQEDGKGSYSYRVQAFRRELDLPEGADPETVTCRLADGKLHIEAPTKHTAAIAERLVPINCKTTEAKEHKDTDRTEALSTEAETKQQ